MSRLIETARAAAQTARRHGAQDARVKVWRSREVRVEWRDGKLERVRESTTQRLGAALFVDGRFVDGSTSDLRAEAVDTWLRDMVAGARYLSTDPHRRLPPPARYEGVTRRPLDLGDPTVSALTPEQRLTTARALEQAVRDGGTAAENAPIVSVSSTVSDRESRLAIVNTNGFEGEKETTANTWVVDVAAKGEEGRKPSDYAYAAARHASDLPPVEQLAREARERTLAQLETSQADTGLYDLVIEARAVPTFSRHLFAPLSGASLQQHRSFFEGRLGQRVASELLTVTDDPHVVRGLGSQAWDSEGMATAARPVFEQGVLRSFYIDTYYGSKLEVEPTSGDRTNLVWATGERPAAGMVPDLGRGILVTGFLGGNSNGTTGDFSLGIQGFLVEGGRIVRPVSEMNVAGNHLDFWTKLVEVGNDPLPWSSNRAPSLRFAGVQCSGA